MTDSCHELEPLGSAFLDGVLEPAEHAAVGAHLAACPGCRDAVDGLARTRALLRSLPVRRVPSGLLADVPVDAGDVAADADDVPDSTVPAVPPGAAVEPAPTLSAVTTGRAPARRRATRTAATLAVLGVLGGAAFSLGDRPPEARTVAVPVDLFVADHLAQTARAPMWSPVLVEATQ